MGTHLSTAISCQASPHFKLNSAHKAQRENERKKGEKKEKEMGGKKRERCNIENVRISSKYVYRKPASWAEIANIKHLLQLMFNP